MRPQIFLRSSFSESLSKLNMNYAENIIIHSGKFFAESHALHSVMEISKALGAVLLGAPFFILCRRTSGMEASYCY